MSRWLAVVGIGEDGLEGLGAAARALIDGAEILVGGERHLAMIPPDDRPRRPWPTPLATLIDEIAGMRGRRVCVLATGNPMWFGVGVALARRVPAEEMTVVPAPSAFALACARLGWSLGDVDTLTLHGRPVDLIVPAVQPGARLVVLSADADTPAAVAARLAALGYGPSAITVLERMGGPAERRLDGTAASWGTPAVDPFNTLAITCRAEPGVLRRPRLAGLPDDAFDHDGQMTKREVRAATLAALAPAPGERLWDVGAGSGSVSIEWARADHRNRAIAIEPRADRCSRIAGNAAALGVPLVEIVGGRAPEALAGLAPPDAVFIGGGIGADGVVEACWQALPPGGRLVANAVTLEGEAAMVRHRERLGGDLTRIAVSRAEPVGPFTGWRPLMPVTQWAVTKP